MKSKFLGAFLAFFNLFYFISSQCLNGGTQINGNECICPCGYIGPYCQYYFNNTEVNSNQYTLYPKYESSTFDADPTLNNIACYLTYSNKLNCICKDGYIRNPDMECVYNTCPTKQCGNTGKCLNYGNGDGCSCYLIDSSSLCVSDRNSCDIFSQATAAQSYYGDICIPDHSSCISYDPSNNASTFGFDFKCKCNSDLFSGEFCQKVTNLCETNSCSNGGTCIKTLSSQCCLCPKGYSGINCENEPTKTTAEFTSSLITTIATNQDTTLTTRDTTFQSSSTLTSIESQTTVQYTTFISPTSLIDTSTHLTSTLALSTAQITFQDTTLTSTESQTIVQYTTFISPTSLIDTSTHLTSTLALSAAPLTVQDTTLTVFNHINTLMDTTTHSNITLNLLATQTLLEETTNSESTFLTTSLNGKYEYTTKADIFITSSQATTEFSTSLASLEETSIQESATFIYLTTSSNQDKYDCSVNPCKYDAICKNMTNSSIGYECECTPFYMGVNCDKEEDDCEPDALRCKNNAYCINYVGFGNYECDCMTSYEGKNCEIRINRCEAYKPCRNEGVCYEKRTLNKTEIMRINNESSNEFVCGCIDGFYGAYCEKEVNICLNVKCENGGVCLSYADSNVSFKNNETRGYYHAYKCLCTSYFYGSYCEKMVLSYQIKRIVSTSFGAAAAISIISLYLFVITLDLSKLFCKYEHVTFKHSRNRMQIRTRRRTKKQIHFTYVV